MRAQTFQIRPEADSGPARPAALAVRAVRVTAVSDTHLSAAAPEAQANWEAVLRHIAADAPDIVLHLGDLTRDGANGRRDLDHGRRQLDRLPVPWHAVPGNHDVGDNPSADTPAAAATATDDDRLRHWIDRMGADHWSLTAGGWMLLAVNAQLFGSGLAAEAAQWSWLEHQVGRCGGDQPIALLTHKPLTATEAELAQSPGYRFVPRPARKRLRNLFRGKRLVLVLSGHVHQYRQLHVDGVDHLWVPSTWAVLPDHVQPVLGAKRCGIVTLRLAAGESPRPELVQPDGLAQLTLTQDVPDPYHH